MSTVGGARHRRVRCVVADDEPHEFGLVHLVAGLETADHLPFPEDRRAAALGERFGKVVSDEDHPDTL